MFFFVRYVVGVRLNTGEPSSCGTHSTVTVYCIRAIHTTAHQKELAVRCWMQFNIRLNLIFSKNTYIDLNMDKDICDQIERDGM